MADFAENGGTVPKEESNELSFAERFVFEDSAFFSMFLAADGAGACDPLRTDFVDQLKAGNFNDEVRKQADATGDKTLLARWNGLRNLAFHRLQSDKPMQYLIDAISAFDSATGMPPGRLYARPSNSALMDAKYTERDGDSRLIGPFGEELWSAGTFLAYDILAKKDSTPASELEATPILVDNQVNAEYGLPIGASVLCLTVEQRYGGDGLIMPDWWSLGLLAFPGIDVGNFRTAIEKAMRIAEPKSGYRLYWRLSYRSGFRPEALTDRSAEGAAACCVLALNERTKEHPGPLLDMSAALTATIEPSNDIAPTDLPLGPVDSLEAKLIAACQGGLLSVSFQQGPSDETTYKNENHVAGQVRRSEVHLAGCTTLADAYDSLLLTPKAVADRKTKIVDDWHKIWDPRPTPAEFKNGSGNNT